MCVLLAYRSRVDMCSMFGGANKYWRKRTHTRWHTGNSILNPFKSALIKRFKARKAVIGCVPPIRCRVIMHVRPAESERECVCVCEGVCVCVCVLARCDTCHSSHAHKYLKSTFLNRNTHPARTPPLDDMHRAPEHCCTITHTHTHAQAHAHSTHSTLHIWHACMCASTCVRRTCHYGLCMSGLRHTHTHTIIHRLDSIISVVFGLIIRPVIPCKLSANWS